MSDKFTQADLDRLIAKWKKILMIEHFNVDAKLVAKVNKRDDLGECRPQYAINYFGIKIKDPLYIDEGDADVESTVCHELLHCRRHWEVGETDPLRNVLMEREVEDLSKILVRLHRGQ